MSLVEGTPYDHETYGRVEIVAIEDGVVSWQSTEETQYIRGVGDVPKAGRQRAAEFKQDSEPAPQTVSLPTSEITVETNLL